MCKALLPEGGLEAALRLPVDQASDLIDMLKAARDAGPPTQKQASLLQKFKLQASSFSEAQQQLTKFFNRVHVYS